MAIVSGDPQQQVQTALADADANLRIVGIRIAREHGLDVLPIVEQLKRDPSAAVRRELAIALRHNKNPQAAQLWAELAVQHDGSDRWYIESLGIGADKQWDSFFQAWLGRVEQMEYARRPRYRRCRSPKACHYLAEIIASTPSEQEQLRYFRAFDFHSGDAKQAALKELLATQN
ncbi:MAG: hypothetical protein R3C56_02270 [Pirellulaceae bacterium]